MVSVRCPLLGWSLCLIIAGGCATTRASDRVVAPQESNQGSASAGVLSAEQLEATQETIVAGTPELSRCYTSELERNSQLRGAQEVTLEIQIGVAQAATRVGILRSTLRSPDFIACLKHVVFSWEFPQLKRPFKLTHPVRFSPEIE